VATEYGSGESETYVVPLAFVPKTPARIPSSDVVFANARIGGVDGVLVDALDDAASAHPLLDALLGSVHVAGTVGQLVGTAFEPGLEREAGDGKSQGAKHWNAAIQFGSRYLLKVYRRRQPRRHQEPDAGGPLLKAPPGPRPPPRRLGGTMHACYEIARLVGSKPAGMHVAFASSDDPAFVPEPFS